MKYSMMSRLATTLRSYLQVLSLNRKAWLLPLPSTITATLAITPLGHHTTGSASMMMMETLNAYQRSQRPILYLNRWAKTVDEGARKTSLNLKGTCYWLSKSKRSRRLALPALYSLVAMLSNLTLILIKLTILRGYTRPSSTYIARYLFALGYFLYIALTSNYKTRSARMIMIMIVMILVVTSRRPRRQRRQRRRVTVAAPPIVTTRMTMTTAAIKSVITMKAYDLPNDVSFLLPMMVPP
jgi:hypothetical protein